MEAKVEPRGDAGQSLRTPTATHHSAGHYGVGHDPSVVPGAVYTDATSFNYTMPGSVYPQPLGLDYGTSTMEVARTDGLSYLSPSEDISHFVSPSPRPAFNLESARLAHHYESMGQQIYRTRAPASGSLFCTRVEGDAAHGEPAAGPGRTERNAQFCAVCSDYASGYHYGVWSCEGCKAFFKRSTQGHNDYMCPATNQCTIDRNRRKSCQACRLRKCYEVGMVKGIRKDRKGYRVIKHKRMRLVPRSGVDPVGAIGLMSMIDSPHVRTREEQPECNLLTMEADQLLALLIEAEPPPVYSLCNLNRPASEASLMTALTSLADQELVHMIAWAKKIPGFTAISLHDQVQLLECCWLEILMMGLIWRSLDCTRKLYFAPNLILDRDDASSVEGVRDNFDLLLTTITRFKELQLCRDEYVCLKAIILLNSDGLESMDTIHKMVEKVLDVLMMTIGRREGDTAQRSRRLAHLLLLLSHIRHISNKGIEHLKSIKHKKVIPLYDLILELLDAHHLQKPLENANCHEQKPSSCNSGKPESLGESFAAKAESSHCQNSSEFKLTADWDAITSSWACNGGLMEDHVNEEAPQGSCAVRENGLKSNLQAETSAKLEKDLQENLVKDLRGGNIKFLNSHYKQPFHC
uniref:Estrogen receptor 1 n=1 Tax=Eptatretus burgeri TaxID=7764 RepID=A0A0M4RG34_EPTBU|nr:estrogen receptor 1 [Eptatretus burgeri]